MKKILNKNIKLLRRFYSSNNELDVIVIGGGPGGYVAAIKAAQLGLKTACVEKRGTLGGTCLNVGCIPSKALLNTTHKYHEAKHKFGSYGIKVQNVEVDIGDMMKSKDKAVSGLTKGIEFLFNKNKVQYVKGEGKITSKNQVTVKGLDGKDQVLTTKNILIATGSDATPLPFLPFDENVIVSSTGALSLPKVPKQMLVIGGGVIGLEMGSVWSRLGTEVTVIEFLDKITPTLDGEICNKFLQSLKKQGMKFELNTKVVSGKVENGRALITTEPSAGGEKKFYDVDSVLVAIGRRPYTQNLGLQELGVIMDKQGRIVTDENFKTNIPNIYAIGDVIKGPMLAHKAEDEGYVCAEIISGKKGHVNYNAIPSVIYTHPEVACVGKTEEELKKEGVKYHVGTFPMSANSRARTNDDSEGLVKVIANEDDRVLGVHIIASSAGEMIAECVLGMEYECSSEDIARTCHAHPTLMEAVKEGCLATFDKSIHS